MTGSAAPSSSNVRVVARIRPLSKTESKRGSKETVTSMQQRVGDLDNRLHWNSVSGEPELVEAKGANVDGGKRWFELDAVFDKSSTQEEVYIRSGACRAVCDDIFRGYNATILAYGQTGAGKTHTMGTAVRGGTDVSEEDGMIPRACADLFKTVQEKCDGNAKVELSYLEIYNEEIRDLLATDDKTNLKIRETLNGEIYVAGQVSREVKSPADIGKMMEEASSKRVVAATAMNAVSSRSHAICTLKIAGVLENPEKNEADKFTSKLTLVDLAGSERIKKTGAQGNRRQEGININKGLFVLGQVVSALSEQGKKKKAPARKPPYRDSKLTRLLQDSLGGNSRTIMVACVSPADFNIDESINTLRYATSARNIKNNATRNIVQTITPEEAAALRRENQLLKNEVAELQEALRSFSSPSHADVISIDPASPGDDVPADIIPEEDGSESTDSAQRIRDLEKEVASLKNELQKTEVNYQQSVRGTALELPAMKVEVELLREEVSKSQEIAQENEELRQELEEARSDADSARIAAAKLSDLIDQLKEIKQDEIDKKKVELNHMKKEEAWVLFVDALLDTRAEQMISLSEDFDLVLRVLDSPAVMQTNQKRNWWGKGKGEFEEVYDPELRQKVLREHVDFFKDRMDEMQKDIKMETRSLKQMRKSIQKDCKKLQKEIGSNKEDVNTLGTGKEQDLLAKLTELLIEPESIRTPLGSHKLATPQASDIA